MPGPNIVRMVAKPRSYRVSSGGIVALQGKGLAIVGSHQWYFCNGSRTGQRLGSSLPAGSANRRDQVRPQLIALGHVLGEAEATDELQDLHVAGGDVVENAEARHLRLLYCADVAGARRILTRSQIVHGGRRYPATIHAARQHLANVHAHLLVD